MIEGDRTIAHDRKSRDRKWRQSRNRRYVLRMRNRYILYYYSSSTKCTIAHDRHGYRKWPKVTWPRRRFPWKGVHMRNRKLRNIRPSGAFHRKWRHQTSPVGLPLELEVPLGPTWLPEMTEGHVNPKGVPWKGVRMRNRKSRNIRPSGAFHRKWRH